MAPADVLRGADWDALLPRLTLWAGSLHARYLKDRPGAPEPADLVHDAIADVGTGVRRLPPGVPLPVVLYNVIRSKVSAHLKGPRREALQAPRPDALALPDDRAAAAELRASILAAVRGDNLLEAMCRLWFEDPGLRPADLARLLGVDARALYNARKRLDRRLIRFRGGGSSKSTPLPPTPRPRRTSAMRLLPALVAFLFLLVAPEAQAQAPPSAGLQAWYRADQGVFSDVGCTTASVDGGLVQCWQDQSGNGLTVTPRNGSAPTYDASAVNGEPAVDFAGTLPNQGLVSASTSLLNMTEATIYVVTDSRPTGAEIVVSIAQAGTVNQEFLLANRATYHHSSSANFAGRLGTCNAEGFHMQGGVLGQAATDVENYINGIQNRQPLLIVGSPQPFVAVDRWLLLGARGSNIAGEVSTSRMAEILVYDRKLTDAERLQIEDYFAAKYDFPPVAGDPPFPSANLALWLRGDGCLQTDGVGNVSTWFDESGNGYDAVQGTTTRQPVLDPAGLGAQPAVQFDGTDDYLSLGDVLDDVIAGTDSQFSLFAVAFSDVGDNDIIIGKSAALNGDANRAYFVRYSGGAFGVQAEYTLGSGNFTRETTTAQQVGCAHAFSVTYDGSQDGNGGFDRNTIWVDGVEATTTGTSGGTLGDIQDGPGPLAVGAVANSSGAAGAFMEGAIAEILMFDGVLSTADRQSVETYLLNKYGITPAGCVLPVELTGFTVRLDGTTARLTWETASETDNAGFAVEHRVPEADVWSEAGFVPGAGTTDAPQTYGFSVPNLAPGTHAFRLRQTDFDGATSYSETVELAVALEGRIALAAFPNPSASGTGVVTVALAQSGPATVALYDALGRRAALLHEGEVPAGTVLRLDLPSLPAGTYLVRASAPGATISRAITVVQ